MRVAFSTLFTLAAAVSSVFAAEQSRSHGYGHRHGHSSAPSGAPKGKVFDHFLQIWFENQDFETISALPHFTQLLPHGILLSNYNALTHPSECNYVAAGGASTLGVDNDDYYNIPANVVSIFDLLEKKNLNWKLYQEDLPYTGFTGYSSGTYVRKHNPAVSFDAVGLNKTRLQSIVHSDEFSADIASNSLPNWMFYTPDMNNNGHDTNATYAGNWLNTFYKATLNQSKLLDKTVVLITFDEAATYTRRNRVWSILLGAIPEHLKGTVDSTYYTHYSAINTVEKNWDLGSLGRGDSIKTESNIFAFAADRLNYKNVHVPLSQIPMNNNTIVGLFSGTSRNQTHTIPSVPQ
ncbi:phosphoesterase family-domain-containing protein [Spinellus fusiger]|nr:phosphoesterase family-domain-containing protein [Spinellus fusiger]